VGLYKFGLKKEILYDHNEKKLTNKIIKIKKLNKSKLKRGSFTTLLL